MPDVSHCHGKRVTRITEVTHPLDPLTEAEIALGRAIIDAAGLITETSVITVLAILIFKAIAYTVALGGGFRGGPIFPATFLGVAVAVGGALLLPDASVSALAAAGIAAATAAMIKLPATSALLGALLIGGSGSAIAPFAILGAVIGLGIRLAADRRDARSTASPIEPDLHGPNR